MSRRNKRKTGLTPITIVPREKKGETLDRRGLQPVFPFRMIRFNPSLAGLAAVPPKKKDLIGNEHLLKS